MSAPHIVHVTLTTGHARKSPRDEVGDAALAVLSPWLSDLVESGGKQLPLPVPDLSHFAASATSEGGALVLTLWGAVGPHLPGRPTACAIPMITIGVARRSRHGKRLWDVLVGQFGAASRAEKPPEPWCGVVTHQSISAYRGDVAWMGDFERCVAWAWITRKPDLQSVQ